MSNGTTGTKPGLIFKVAGFVLYFFGIVSLIMMISREKKYGEISFSVLHEQSVMLVFILGAIFHAAGSIIGAIHAASRTAAGTLPTPQTENPGQTKEPPQNNYALIAIVVIIAATILMVVLGKAF